MDRFWQRAENTFEWFDILGAPWWEVCVMMVTPDGCGAMDCMSPEDFQTACDLDIGGRK